MPSSGGQSDAPAEQTAAPAFNIQLHSVSQLRTEIDTVLEGSRDTGQLNPRHPGPINALIQFVKKVMRRSLTWYTRPLHVFEGGVVRALEQIIAILDNHRDILQKTAEELNAQASRIERNRSRLARQIESQSTKLRDFETEFGTRLSRRLAEHEEKLNRALSGYNHELHAADSRSEQRIADVSAEIAALRGELNALRNEGVSQSRMRDRDLRRLAFTVEQNKLGQPAEGARPTPAIPAMFPSGVKGESEFDYFRFEEKYRGEESDIRDRQQSYLEYFRGRDNVVDIGCGRGEFLELLRDNNIPAKGIELGTDQFLLCREKGLDVAQQDLFEFLESMPDESLGGLFSAQVIEHMTASDQLRYVALAYRKTQPGSPVIFETINAQCVYAIMRNFFLDPTHVRPIHPETLKFAMESMKFRNVELRFSGPVSDKQLPPLQLEGGGPELERFNRAIDGLNELIYGYQDYAAIGWK